MVDNINPATGTPREISLADVFNKIKLSPAMVSAFLHTLAVDHLGGPNDELAKTLMKAGNETADPKSYGNETAEQQQAQAGVLAQQQWGAAQAQSDVVNAGSMNEPAWMRDARAAGWSDPNQQQPLTTQQPLPPEPEPAWKAQARAAGWRDDNSDSEKSNTPPQPGSPSAPALSKVRL